LTDVIALPGASPWHHAAADKVSAWLCDQQLEDGTWLDKWHASPYYATAASPRASAVKVERP
jgi:squalene cyclase